MVSFRREELHAGLSGRKLTVSALKAFASSGAYDDFCRKTHSQAFYF